MSFGFAEFWTMTYRDAPETGGWRDMQLFFKRLRKYQESLGNLMPIRFLACGEYGHKSGRFHYHALIWNLLRGTPQELHTRLWPHGFAYIGTVTPKSIRYTARYCLKFEKKGQEALATWSKRPPLGEAGMRELSAYMRNRGDRLTEPPSALQINGTWYPLDDTMKFVFMSEWTGRPVKFLRAKGLGSASASHLRYLLERKLGDPVEAQRQLNEERSKFWETARLEYGKL